MGLFSSLKKICKAVAKPASVILSKVAVLAPIPLLPQVSSIVSATISKGPLGGFKAALNAAPSVLKVAAIAFPAALPVIAMQEVALRTLKAAKSSSPKLAAGAALQIAATTKMAKTDPNAARALRVLTETSRAQKLLVAAQKAPPGKLKSALEAKAAKNPVAGLLYLRSIEAATKSKNPKLRLSALQARKRMIAEDPSMGKAFAGIKSAQAAVKPVVQAREFSVTRIGRVMLKGRPVRAV